MILSFILFSGVLSTFFYVVYFAVVLTTIFFVILENRNPVRTMAWLLVLVFLPLVGLFLYLFIGRSTKRDRLISRNGYMRLNKRPMAEFQSQASLKYFTGKPRLMQFFGTVNKALPFEGNAVEVYTDGYSMLAALIQAVSKAKHHIHIEFYIFEDDAVGRLFRDVLIDKARQGVEIRVLYDDVGCWKIPHLFYEQMMYEGIEVQSFLKVRFPLFTSKVNYRNHRKIVVIDGKVGFIGGMNIAGRYIWGVPWGRWRDTHVQIQGKAVYGLQTTFLTDWYFVNRILLTATTYFPKIDNLGNSVAQIVTSDPTGEWKDIMQGLVLAISSSRSYFYIQSPYLLPTDPVLVALQSAALSGVDVRIMIPKHADTFITHKGSLSYLEDMMKAGIRIYLYKPGFLHSKLMVSDDEFSTVGSTNMDFRSFEHNFEANAFFYDKETALTFKQIFLDDQKECMLLAPKIWSRRSWKSKVTESVVRLLAPVL